MGLANRVVAKGEARSAAEALAREIARMPQLCLKNDRTSVYEQFGLSMHAALANEFRLGMETLVERRSPRRCGALCIGQRPRGKF